MGRRAIVIAVALVLAGCTGGTGPQPAATEPLAVSHAGLAEIELGDSRGELERDHGMVQDLGDCAPHLPTFPSVSPVLEDNRLVLLWVDPPLGTSTGIMVGSPVAEVHDAHPDAEELPAPPGSFRFDGLLDPVDDRAYLFLHDQQQVRKVIVGYEEHTRLLFHEDFGTC